MRIHGAHSLDLLYHNIADAPFPINPIYQYYNSILTLLKCLPQILGNIALTKPRHI